LRPPLRGCRQPARSVGEAGTGEVRDGAPPFFALRGIETNARRSAGGDIGKCFETAPREPQCGAMHIGRPNDTSAQIDRSLLVRIRCAISRCGGHASRGRGHIKGQSGLRNGARCRAPAVPDWSRSPAAAL
jgi:hypothetical protein